MKWLEEAGVNIVTGDTKVVEHGAADLLFINTQELGGSGQGLTFQGQCQTSR